MQQGGPQPYYNYNPQNMATRSAGAFDNRLRKPADTGTEAWIGKILMGALASLLVFIALVTFARVIIPYVSDPVKIAFMFIASIALTAGGYLLSIKRPKNTFFTALMACGAICIYLSIVVTSVYYHAVSPVVMYVLLAVWAALIIFLARQKQGLLFPIIGNLGFMVSILFSARLEDKTLVMPMLIYAVVIGGVFQFISWKNAGQRKAQCIINMAAVLALQIIVSIHFKNTAEMYIVGAVAVVWTFVMILLHLGMDFVKYEVSNFYIAAISTICFYIAYVFVNMSLHLPSMFSLLIIVIPALIFEGTNMYLLNKGINKPNSIINTVFTGIIFFIAAIYAGSKVFFLVKYGILNLFFGLIAAYGILRKKISFKAQGWTLFLLVILGCLFEDIYFAQAAVVTTLLLIAFVVEGYILNNSVAFKILSYFSIIGWIMKLAFMLGDLEFAWKHGDVVAAVTFMILGVLNAVLILTRYYNTRTRVPADSEHFHLVLDIINVLYMMFGTFLMCLSDNLSVEVIYFATVMLMACINLPVGKRGKKGRYIYAGIKLGLILLIALANFKVPSFLLSIIMVAFAVICIAIGFKNRLIAKELRIYGIILTLFFVAKFVLFDIRIDSAAAKVISYLILAVMLFGISGIYNYFEKQGKNAG